MITTIVTSQASKNFERQTIRRQGGTVVYVEKGVFEEIRYHDGVVRE